MVYIIELNQHRLYQECKLILFPFQAPLAPLSVCLFELFIKIDIFVKRDPASFSCHLGNCNLGDNHLRGLAPTICHLRLQHLANGLGLQPETILWVFPTEDRLLIFRLIVKNISHFSPSYTFSTLLNEEQHPKVAERGFVCWQGFFKSFPTM